MSVVRGLARFTFHRLASTATPRYEDPLRAVCCDPLGSLAVRAGLVAGVREWARDRDLETCGVLYFLLPGP